MQRMEWSRCFMLFSSRRRSCRCFFAVMLVQHLVAHAVQFIARQQREHVPAEIKRGCDGTVFKFALTQKSVLQRLAEFQIKFVERAQFLLADEDRKSTRLN